MTIDQLLIWSRRELASSDSASIDANTLLCFVTGKNTAFLYAHGEEFIRQFEAATFENLVNLRKKGHPIAYLTGSREFWSLDLTVNEDVLIPRHDTELIVETLLSVSESLGGTHLSRVLDLGTGSGAIALAAASELPNWEIVGVDISQAALRVAEVNQRKLALANVQFVQGCWYQPLKGTCYEQSKFDIIISNPPYIRKDDIHLDRGDVRFEPIMALVSDEEGYADLKKIIYGSAEFLSPNGWIILEHGFDQAKEVRRILLDSGFDSIQTHRDLGGNERVTKGRTSV
ncbi:MAG: peptide chain release factor N(5)-glutamine methyltransferase [Gammaproteobacteria bacterium]|nr:peptide chain release factor N(5)-glutamine methyltransferase [Gammaproteobacteria bacterium]